MPTKIRLEWPANPSSELVTEYKVWQSKDGSPLAVVATVNQPVHEIVNPLPGLYKWALSAINFVGASSAGPSADGPSIPTPPPAPNISIVIP